MPVPCPACGAAIPDGAPTCPACGAASPALAAPAPEVPRAAAGERSNASTWLGLSIFSTLCCCPPFGIVGAVYAARAMGHEEAGSVDRAVQLARTAKIWSLVALGAGVLVYGGYFLLVMVVGMGGMGAELGAP